MKKLDTNMMRFLDWSAMYKSLKGFITIASAIRKLRQVVKRINVISIDYKPDNYLTPVLGTSFVF